MPEMTLVDAVNMALARAMEDDPNVVVFGEDVGVNGGVFRATVGLQQRSDRSACSIRRLPNSLSADSASAWRHKA